MYAYMYVCMSAHIYSVHTYILTFIHTYIYTYTPTYMEAECYFKKTITDHMIFDDVGDLHMAVEGMVGGGGGGGAGS